MSRPFRTVEESSALSLAADSLAASEAAAAAPPRHVPEASADRVATGTGDPDDRTRARVAARRGDAGADRAGRVARPSPQSARSVESSATARDLGSTRQRDRRSSGRRLADWVAAPVGRLLDAADRLRSMGRAVPRARNVGVAQIVCWQLIVLLLLAVVDAHRLVKIAAVITVATVAAMITVRFRGKLIATWSHRGVRYLMRQRTATLGPGAETASDLVDHLARRAWVAASDVDGVAAGFIHRPDGIAAIVEVTQFGTPGGCALDDLVSAVSLFPLTDSGSPPFAAQVLLHSAPGDDGMLSSERGRLTDRAWVALQVIRTPEVSDDATLQLALVSAVHRLLRRLRRADVLSRPLDREETLALVTALAHIDETDIDLPVSMQERWDSWHAGATAHVSFRLGHWRSTSPQSRRLVVQRLELMPTLGTTVAVIAHSRASDRPDDTDDCELIVRLAESDPVRLGNSAGLFEFALRDIDPKLVLERLDGAQMAAVAATLPLGVGMDIAASVP